MSELTRAEHMLRWFKSDHLPADLAAVAEKFAHLAEHVVHTLPPGPEHTTALRKLLEAKDCAVRAVIDGRDAEPLR